MELTVSLINQKLLFFAADCHESMGFLQRDQCGPWNPVFESLYYGSHITIGLCYYIIAGLLAHAIVFSKRKGLGVEEMMFLTRREKRQMRAAASAFIFTCGIGHHLDGAGAFHWPEYHFFAIWHFITALVSIWAVTVCYRLRSKLVVGL